MAGAPQGCPMDLARSMCFFTPEVLAANDELWDSFECFTSDAFGTSRVGPFCLSLAMVPLLRPMKGERKRRLETRFTVLVPALSPLRHRRSSAPFLPFCRYRAEVTPKANRLAGLGPSCSAGEGGERDGIAGWTEQWGAGRFRGRMALLASSGV